MLVCFILGVNFVHFTKFLPNFSSKKISFPFVIRKYSVEWYFETMNILFPNSLLHNSFNIFWWFLYESIITMGVIKWWFFCSVITWTDRFFFVSQFLLLFILMLNLTTIWPVGPPSIWLLCPHQFFRTSLLSDTMRYSKLTLSFLAPAWNQPFLQVDIVPFTFLEHEFQSHV